MFCQIITTSSEVQLTTAIILLLHFSKLETGLITNSLCVCVCVCVYVHVFGRKSHRQCKNRNFICIESFKTNLAERVESGNSTSGEGHKGGDDVFVAMNLHVLHMAACVFTT